MKIISKSTNAFNVLIRVIVFPEPGGPQSKNGLCSLSQAQSTSLCLRVSIVSITKSASVTLAGSISIYGTLFLQGRHSPSGRVTSKSINDGVDSVKLGTVNSSKLLISFENFVL